MDKLKEFNELMDGIEVLVKMGAEVLEDGKIRLNDIGALVSAIREFDKLKAAVEGADKIKEELKDIDGEGIGIIIDRLVSLVKVIKK